MAEYRQVEYRIGKDGKITETVLNATGSSCTEITAGVEKALGKVESQELLPEYYQGEEILTTEQTQTLKQV
ncbi:hypothetical protein C7B69_07765 [filamentous cyanobacterium Phorm 46]|nr:hypothetical protein C7B69_07765 [filamentous cyanobacterium Phorm 46]PSB40299.1 hypothetical protein C7B67_28550 [filamentous cyanobacterium Phorm 6]